MAGQAGMPLGNTNQVTRPEDADARQAPEAGRGAGRGRRRRDARAGAPAGAGEAAEGGGAGGGGDGGGGGSGGGRGGRARGAGGRGRGSGAGSHAAPGAKAPMRVLEARCPSLVALLGRLSGWPLGGASEALQAVCAFVAEPCWAREAFWTSAEGRPSVLLSSVSPMSGSGSGCLLWCCTGSDPSAQVPPGAVRLMPADVTAAGCCWRSSSAVAQACSGYA